jgi:hypothetical protein
MRLERFATTSLLGAAILVVLCSAAPAAGQAPDTAGDEAACAAMTDVRNLTIIAASFKTLPDSDTKYCYVRGLIRSGIHYHVQLPLPRNWNGRPNASLTTSTASWRAIRSTTSR